MMAGMRTIKHTMRYEGVTTDQVFEMLATPAFREEVCEAQKVVSSKVEQTRDGNRLSSRVEQVQNTEGVPAFAKKIVGDKTTVIQAEEWSSPTSAKLTVTIPGKPGTIEGTVEMSESGGGVDEVVTLHLTVGIPLVGGKIENILAELLTKAMRKENETGKKWLTR